MINFQSKDLDFSGIFEKAEQIEPQKAHGHWYPIKFKPSIFSPQEFVIGVALLLEQDARLHFRLIEDTDLLESLYENSGAANFEDSFTLLEKTIRENKEKPVESLNAIIGEQFTISPRRYTSGMDEESIIDTIYNEAVVIDRFTPKQTHKINEIQKFKSIDTNQARELVNEKLKEIAGIDYERIICGHSQDIIDGTGQRHRFDFNIKTATSCGSVTSACYKTPSTVELNLLKTSRDLTTYSRVNKLDNIGLFLLLPDNNLLEKSDIVRIENVIDEYDWKLEKDGFRVVSHHSPTFLANELYEWAKPSIRY